jgi:inosine/xanthosine triphosphatase
MRILVASSNPVKIGAAEQAARAMFPGQTITVEGTSRTLDKLPAQPMGDEETRNCAMERVKFMRKHRDDADYYVGIEGGLAFAPNVHGEEQLECFAWFIIQDKDGTLSETRSASFILPPAIKTHILAGDELGHATDKVFAKHNSKQGGGTVAELTNNLIDRTAFYVHPLILAFIPFRKPELYQAA